MPECRYGVLFQNGALFSSLTVAQNVMVPLREHADLSPDLMSEIAANKVAMAGLPRDACAKYPSELSGGHAQARGTRTCACTGSGNSFSWTNRQPVSTPIGAAEFDKLIGDLQQTLGLTVVMVTHDLDSLYAICDRRRRAGRQTCYHRNHRRSG